LSASKSISRLSVVSAKTRRKSPSSLLWIAAMIWRRQPRKRDRFGKDGAIHGDRMRIARCANKRFAKAQHLVSEAEVGDDDLLQRHELLFEIREDHRLKQRRLRRVPRIDGALRSLRTRGDCVDRGLGIADAEKFTARRLKNLVVDKMGFVFRRAPLRAGFGMDFPLAELRFLNKGTEYYLYV
jgi:hypothetical protein